METETEIYFYTLKCKFDYMSNFYKTTFQNKNRIKFNCSEQYFMYIKCLTFDPTNTNLLQLILQETSATKIKKLGRSIFNYDDNVWSQIRYQVMLDALRLKFNQNEIIKQKLIATKPKLLYEASKNDKIWGIGFYDNVAIHKKRKISDKIYLVKH